MSAIALIEEKLQKRGYTAIKKYLEVWESFATFARYGRKTFRNI